MTLLLHSLVAVLLILCPVALSRHDDDFAFDNSEEFQVELAPDHTEITKNGLRRLWGVPDTSAYAGHLFRMEIPKEAFTGTVVRYKVRLENGKRAPSWLAVDTKHGLISGVPVAQDIGTHAFTVIAQGHTDGLTASDTFNIEVKKAEEKPQSKYGHCTLKENRLTLVILIDKPFHETSSRQRIKALMELANFMALSWDEFWIGAYKAETGRDQAVVMSGAGTTPHKKSAGTTGIFLNVGCGDTLWTRHKVLVAGIREQSRDGTLAQILRLPVLGWRLIAAKPAPRLKRQLPVEGSGYTYDDDDDGDDYSGYEDNDDNDNSDIGGDYDERQDPLPTQTVPSSASHPHRHHHGDTIPDAPGTTPTHTTFQTEDTEPTTTTPTTPQPTTLPTTTSTTTISTIPTTSTTTPTPITTTEEIPIVVPAFEETTPVPATSTNAIVTEDSKRVKIEAFTPLESTEESRVGNPRYINPSIIHSPVFIYPETDPPPTTEAETQTVVIRPSNEVPQLATPSTVVTYVTPPPSTTERTTPSTTRLTTASTTSTTTASTTPLTTILTTPSTTPVPETTLPETTPEDPITASERSSTIIGRTTETITFANPVNQPPRLNHHMKKLATTAGKAFRYIIPTDLFIDPEDETNLTFTMYDGDHIPLRSDSWLQFLPEAKEVYGLPLEVHVSKWHFIVEARDVEGESATAPLDIAVQEHKSKRTFNHEFVMKFKLMQPYKNDIDWQIRALEGIMTLFRDTDMEQLTVLNVSSHGDLHEFVWTNDTLPKETCPTDDINRLMKIAESDHTPGEPSGALARAMLPQLKVASVSWRGSGVCAPPAPKAQDTYPPVTRNQVDLIRATVGHLLVFNVPEDTFFDPEDGSTRNLNLSLRLSDRSALPESNWLQFDSKNQEFYGLPSSSDEGNVLYQLVAEDSSKKSAYDSLVVEVVKAPAIKPTVEFHMTMEYPYELIAENAAVKRKIVEKLAALFGQKGTANIRIQSITDEPTTIVWYNTSLPMDRCPKEEIEELRRMIIADESGSFAGALKEVVDVIFDKDYKVMSIRLVPLGLCAEQQTKIRTMNSPGNADSKTHNTKSVSTDGYMEYLLTFVIPAVVIVCMILVAGIIACVLYRRRRTGKMSVGDEEERQAFRSKGIPVIFQDELEERGDSEPVHKSPVIMREEKPPLLPPAPDYRQNDDAPYRPPPPIIASHTPPRPKATPSYRKPPPYVPP